MKIVLKTLKPRNPLVAPAQFRRAGAHQSDRRDLRRAGQRELRSELHRLKHSP